MRFVLLLVTGCTSGGVVYLPGAGWAVKNADGKYAPVDNAYEAVGVSANAVMAYRDDEMIPGSNDATETTEITVDPVQPGDDYRGQPLLPTDCMTQVMMFSSIGGSAFELPLFGAGPELVVVRLHR